MKLDLSIPHEVTRAILDSGGLTKDEVREAWGLGEEEYRELQRRLADHPEIEPGPQGTGGFQARRRRGRLPEEAVGALVLLRADWEARSVERLVGSGMGDGVKPSDQERSETGASLRFGRSQNRHDPR